MAIPDSDDGEFHVLLPSVAPYKSPLFFDKQAGTTVLPGYTEVAWNRQGQQGAQGPPGEQGPAGASATLDVRFSVTELNREDFGQNDHFHVVCNAAAAPGGSLPTGAAILPMATLYDLGLRGNQNFLPLHVTQIYVDDSNRTLHFLGTNDLSSPEQPALKFTYVFLVKG